MFYFQHAKFLPRKSKSLLNVAPQVEFNVNQLNLTTSRAVALTTPDAKAHHQPINHLYKPAKKQKPPRFLARQLFSPL